MRTLPNLAASPFVNDRPIRRLIGVLWGVAVLLLLFNAYRYWRYATTNVEGRDQLQSIRDATDRELESIEGLRAELAGFNLRSQNDEIDFLNRRIAERSFPWSELFEQLGEVLPRGVRVRSLAPQLPQPQSQRRRQRGAEEARVMLRIVGSAEDGEALLDFVDRLFDHPAFTQPLLERESRQTGTNLIDFNLETQYRPRLEQEEAEADEPTDITDAAATEPGATLASSSAGGAESGVETPPAAGSQPALNRAEEPVPGVARSIERDAREGSANAREESPEARRGRDTRPGSPRLGPGSRSLPTPRQGTTPPGRDTTTPERSRPNASSPPGAGGRR